MEGVKWESDGDLPGSAIVYVRVNETFINTRGPEIGLPKEAAFYNTPRGGDDLSADWNKYSDPKKSREQIGLEYKHGKSDFKDPSKFYIVSFLVQDIEDLNLGQEVKHSPRQENFPNQLEGSPWNRAHCSIEGRDEERRLKMKDIAKWEIHPPEYDQSADSRTFKH